MLRSMFSAQFVRFTIVGGAGFSADALTLILFADVMGISPFIARLMSAVVALSVTWPLNRYWSFGTTGTARAGAEYLRYGAVIALSLAINYAIFSALILWGPAFMRTYLVLPLGIASAVGLLVNFFGSKFWVFTDTSA